MEFMAGPFAYIEDTYRRERLMKDYARSAGHPGRLRAKLGRAGSRSRREAAG